MVKKEGIWLKNVKDNWVTGIIDDKYWFQAKVYSDSSTYGIYNGRISKLTIVDDDRYNHAKLLYEYDRGSVYSTKKGLKLRGRVLKAFPKGL